MKNKNSPHSNSQSLKELESLLGKDSVQSSPDMVEHYGKDSARFFKPCPIAVVFPKSTSEVKDTILWANSSKVALVPSGGRTGLSGGAVAQNGEVILSLEKMNQILDWNPTDFTLRCQAGTITQHLQEEAEKRGAFFPVQFAAQGSSQIGGNVATNVGGVRVLRYGQMRNWVVGLEVVTGRGEILRLNHALEKNATGYDFRHLFIGSEGTLGVITEVTLKLAPPPSPSTTLILGAHSLEGVLHVFQEFRKSSQLTAFETFTHSCLKYVLESSDLSPPFPSEFPYYLLIELESEVDHSPSEQVLSAFERCAEKEWIADGIMSQSHQQAKNFWAYRENISESIQSHSPFRNDVSVRISEIPAFIEEFESMIQNTEPDLSVVWFGHIGDGNLHIDILKPESLSQEEFQNRCSNIAKTLFGLIQKYEGSISAEHGVGLVKKPYLHFSRSAEEISLMKQIKTLFDPAGILNPGKIFD